MHFTEFRIKNCFKPNFWLPGLIMLLFSLAANGQDSIRGNPFIESHSNELALKLAVTNNTDFFAVSSPTANYTLLPNTLYKTKLFLSYRFVQFSISFAPKFIPGNNDEDEKGKSNILSFATSIDLDHWIQRFSFDKIKGFYIENPYYGLNNQEVKYLLFPDISYIGFTGNTAYRVNPNFSMLALESQTERQLTSAGTLMPILSYRYFIVDDKTTLNGTNSSQKSNNFETNLSLGYFYTLVINRSFYASAGMAAGFGMVWTKLLTRQPQGNSLDRTSDPLFRGEAMGALGYNADRFFAGFQALGIFEKHDQHHTSTFLKHEAFSMQVFVGYRFDAPKILKKTLDTVHPNN